ncbi:MAG: glutamate--tRNA ligase [Atopobiaceae bacterium]
MTSSNTVQRPVRVRFAPSPTGKLHVGGARTAIFNWAFARATGGTFILRIDDTDPNRSTDENTQVILRAMHWLGLDWDEGVEVGGPFGPYKQTDRLDIYRKAAQKLVEQGKAYPCFCTPEKLAADKKAAQQRHDPFQGYQRTCRAIDPAEAARRVAVGEPHTIRIKVPEDRGDVVIEDAVHGEVIFNARELDDFIIVRSDGTPTYNFTTVVDDAMMGITHVIRGDDHLSNTPRQIIVYEALGVPIPIFAHISMILGPDGKKLSKRHGATSVEEYRDAGYLPDALVNYLALLGWAPDGQTTIITREKLCREFSLDHVSKNPATFDYKKLDWIQQQYLQAMSDSEFSRHVLVPQLVAEGLERGRVQEVYETRSAWFDLLSSVLKPRTTLLPQAAEKARFLYEGAKPSYDEKSVAKNLAKEGTHGFLVAARDVLATLSQEDWRASAIEAALAPLPERLMTTKRRFYGALRVAVCGNQVSPPLGVSLELLGRNTALARIDNTLPLTL